MIDRVKPEDSSKALAVVLRSDEVRPTRMGLVGLKNGSGSTFEIYLRSKGEKNNLADSHYSTEDAVCPARPFTFPPRLIDT